MQFSLSDEQLALQDTARRFARDEIAPIAGECDATSTFPRDIIRKAWELGLSSTVIPGEYFREMDGGFFPLREEFTRFVMWNLGDFFFCQSFLPCNCKAGVHSEMTFVLSRDHQAREFGDLRGHGAAGFKFEREIKIDELAKHVGCVGQHLYEAGTTQFFVVLTHDGLQIFRDLLERNGAQSCHGCSSFKVGKRSYHRSFAVTTNGGRTKRSTIQIGISTDSLSLRKRKNPKGDQREAAEELEYP